MVVATYKDGTKKDFNLDIDILDQLLGDPNEMEIAHWDGDILSVR